VRLSTNVVAIAIASTLALSVPSVAAEPGIGGGFAGAGVAEETSILAYLFGLAALTAAVVSVADTGKSP